MIIILMGVSGVGKTTVGQALAAELHWKFVDADDYHSPANVAKMHAGIPLDDADRASWLQELHHLIEGWVQGEEPVVLACSALKASYREQLVLGPDVKLVYLRAPFGFVVHNQAARHGHYMNPDLLQSQFDTLEEPLNAMIVQANRPVMQIITEIRTALAI